MCPQLFFTIMEVYPKNMTKRSTLILVYRFEFQFLGWNFQWWDYQLYATAVYEHLFIIL